MKMWVSEAERHHYRALATEERLLIGAGRKAWRKVEASAPVESWRHVLSEGLMPVVGAQQTKAALLGSEYSAFVLADQQMWVAPGGFVDPRAFAGLNPMGGNLESQLLEPAYRAQRLIGGGMKERAALKQVENQLLFMLVTNLADVSRAAAQIDVGMREGVGYTRVVHPSACDRCIILAGKFYRWNEGFLRHPNCRCEHQATTSKLSEGMFDDPYEVFESLSREEQDRRWGKANAEAIREGADIFQVTNAKRGMTKTRMFTTSGTTKRGHAGSILKPGQRRLTPEAIRIQANGNRVKYRELLTEHGYLLPAGQVPTGSLRGRVEGFGQLGKGGKAEAAREAVLEARRTGVRDPRNRYTMTAAERRLYDAEMRYRMVLEGRNPFDSPGFGSTPDPHGLKLNVVGKGPGKPLTPAIAAMVEADYRRWLVTGGEKFRASTPAATVRMKATSTRTPLPPKPLAGGSAGGGKKPPKNGVFSSTPMPGQGDWERWRINSQQIPLTAADYRRMWRKHNPGVTSGKTALKPGYTKKHFMEGIDHVMATAPKQSVGDSDIRIGRYKGQLIYVKQIFRPDGTNVIWHAYPPDLRQQHIKRYFDAVGWGHV